MPSIPNMSYCKFRNTEQALDQCLVALEDLDDGSEAGISEEGMSREEKEAGIAMFERFLEYCEEAEIITGYDVDRVSEIFNINIEDIYKEQH